MTVRMLLVVLVFGALGFTAFKAGFIRQDLHTLLAWNAAALASAAYAGLEDGKFRRRLAIVGCFACLAVPFALLNHKAKLPPQAVIVAALQQVGVNVSGLTTIVADPGAWLKAQQAAMQQARAAIRAASPLPAIKGTVDVLPSMQSDVIAAGLDYRPRFTIQDYTAYTLALIDKDRDSWLGGRSPDHILFGLMPIDNRLPALSEGPLWPELLRYFEPTEQLPSLVLLSARRHPLPDLLGAPSRRTARLGEAFPLAQEPTFVALGLDYSLLGRAMGLLFKPPEVELRLTFAGGRQIAYRLVPEIARGGFVIAPHIVNANDYLTLALGDRAAFRQDQWPIAAAVETDGAWAYRAEIDVTERRLDLAPLAAARPAGMSAAPR